MPTQVLLSLQWHVETTHAFGAVHASIQSDLLLLFQIRLESAFLHFRRLPDFLYLFPLKFQFHLLLNNLQLELLLRQILGDQPWLLINLRLEVEPVGFWGVIFFGTQLSVQWELNKFLMHLLNGFLVFKVQDFWRVFPNQGRLSFLTKSLLQLLLTNGFYEFLHLQIHHSC